MKLEYQVYTLSTYTSLYHIYLIYNIYVSNVLINLLLFELSNFRKVQLTKWNSCKNPLIDRLMIDVIKRSQKCEKS